MNESVPKTGDFHAEDVDPERVYASQLRARARLNASKVLAGLAAFAAIGAQPAPEVVGRGRKGYMPKSQRASGKCLRKAARAARKRNR